MRSRGVISSTSPSAGRVGNQSSRSGRRGYHHYLFSRTFLVFILPSFVFVGFCLFVAFSVLGSGGVDGTQQGGGEADTVGKLVRPSRNKKDSSDESAEKEEHSEGQSGGGSVASFKSAPIVWLDETVSKKEENNNNKIGGANNEEDGGAKQGEEPPPPPLTDTRLYPPVHDERYPHIQLAMCQYLPYPDPPEVSVETWAKKKKKRRRKLEGGDDVDGNDDDVDDEESLPPLRVGETREPAKERKQRKKRDGSPYARWGTPAAALFPPKDTLKNRGESYKSERTGDTRIIAPLGEGVAASIGDDAVEFVAAPSSVSSSKRLFDRRVKMIKSTDAGGGGADMLAVIAHLQPDVSLVSRRATAFAYVRGEGAEGPSAGNNKNEAIYFSSYYAPPPLEVFEEDYDILEGHGRSLSSSSAAVFSKLISQSKNVRDTQKLNAQLMAQYCRFVTESVLPASSANRNNNNADNNNNNNMDARDDAVHYYGMRYSKAALSPFYFSSSSPLLHSSPTTTATTPSSSSSYHHHNHRKHYNLYARSILAQRAGSILSRLQQQQQRDGGGGIRGGKGGDKRSGVGGSSDKGDETDDSASTSTIDQQRRAARALFLLGRATARTQPLRLPRPAQSSMRGASTAIVGPRPLPHVRVLVGIPTVDTEVGEGRRRVQRSSWLGYAQNYDSDKYKRQGEGGSALLGKRLIARRRKRDELNFRKLQQQQLEQREGIANTSSSVSSSFSSSALQFQQRDETMVLVRYILGRHHSHNYAFSNRLVKEASEHNDILFFEMKEGKPSTAKTSGGSGHWGLEAEVGMSRKALYWYVLAPKLYSFDFIAKADDDVFLRIPQYLCDLEHKVMPFAAALSVSDEDTHEHVDSGGNHVEEGGIGRVRSKKCPPFNRMIESSREQFQCGSLAADSIFSRIKAGFEEEAGDDHPNENDTSIGGKENRALKSDTDTLFIEHFRAQKQSNNNRTYRTRGSSSDEEQVNGASSTSASTGRCPLLPPSVAIAHQGHTHVNQRPLNAVSGGIYWGKVMKWKAAKDDSSSEFLFVGGMCITMSRDVASLVASDEELYRMSGPFVFFDPEGVFEREKGNDNEIAVGFGEANAKQKRRNKEALFLRKLESVMSTAAQVKASTGQIFIKTTITKSGGGDEKEKNNENNVHDQHPDDVQIGGGGVAENAAIVGSDGKPSSGEHVVRFVFVLPPVTDSSSSIALGGHGDGDGEGAVLMNAPPPPIAQQQQGRSNEGRRKGEKKAGSYSENADQDRSLLGVGGIGDMLSVVLRHSFLNSAVGGGTEASAKPIYKVRNMDHEDVMVGRSLYTRARAARGEEESEGGGGGGDAFLAADSSPKSNSNSKLTKGDTSINSMPLTFLKRAAITMTNISDLDEFFPTLRQSDQQQHDSQRHLKPIAAAYTLRQALGIAIVDDCRYHDVHTGHNRAPITDKSVAIHHLMNAQYSELFARFSDDGQKEEESGERCRCLDTRMSDGFRRGHPIIRLC